jgi:hypothetical protein
MTAELIALIQFIIILRHADESVSLQKNERNNVRINATLRRVRATIVPVQKQQVLPILSVCL